MDELKSAVITLAEHDTSIADADLIIWLNQGIQRINTILNSNFPILPNYVVPPNSTVPAFDVRYHEALVVFAVGKYREADSDYNSATYMMNQFMETTGLMKRDMAIPPSYQVSDTVQQIVVTDITVLTYNLVMLYGSYFDKIDVYQNNILLTDDGTVYSIDQLNRQITFTNIILAVNDQLTIDFQLNSVLNQPPYEWWTGSGW